MALLRAWKYVFPLLAFVAIVMDIRFSSYIVNRWAIHFHHGWLYLLAVLLPVFAIFFYFYSYKHGNMYRYTSKADYTVKHWIALIASIPIAAVVSAYLLFHAAIWLASYTPILPTLSRELTIVQLHPSSRGGRMFIATDSDDNRLEIRTYGLYWHEGDIVRIDCVQIGSICRIADATVLR